jgi:hypothetical protein
MRLACACGRSRQVRLAAGSPPPRCNRCLVRGRSEETTEGARPTSRRFSNASTESAPTIGEHGGINPQPDILDEFNREINTMRAGAARRGGVTTPQRPLRRPRCAASRWRRVGLLRAMSTPWRCPADLQSSMSAHHHLLADCCSRRRGMLWGSSW